jgi:hypothetical protein
LVGLPEFPASYKKLQRLPIESKVIAVGKRVVEEEKTLGNAYYSEAAWYTVTIGAGTDKGVKVGMKFDISEIEDELFITQVNQKTSIGLIRRSINDNKMDSCFDENSDETECPKIKTSLKVKTQIGKFWW